MKVRWRHMAVESANLSPQRAYAGFAATTIE
jgi:hypothetical protein